MKSCLICDRTAPKLWENIYVDSGEHTSLTSDDFAVQHRNPQLFFLFLRNCANLGQD